MLPKLLELRPVGVLALSMALTMATTSPAHSGELAAPKATTASTQELPKIALLAAEERFNRAAKERDRETFHGLLTADSVFLAGELHQGRLEVAAIWQPLFDGKYGFTYEGTVIDAGVARSGELAWAIGAVKTSFQRPGLATPEETDSHYLHVWSRSQEASWRLAYAATLVVHPELGAARDPRSGLMTAWPELADQPGSNIDLSWHPTKEHRAESGELAVTFGEYEASFTPQPTEPKTEAVAETEAEDEDSAPEAIAGKGHFLAVWKKDEKGHWQLVGEGFTPPGIYGGE